MSITAGDMRLEIGHGVGDHDDDSWQEVCVYCAREGHDRGEHADIAEAPELCPICFPRMTQPPVLRVAGWRKRGPVDTRLSPSRGRLLNFATKEG